MEVRKSILSIFWVFLLNKISQFLYRTGRNKHTVGKYFPKILNVQCLISTYRVEISPKINKRTCTYIRQVRVHTVTVCIKYLVESAHISAIAYCIKLEVDITKRVSFGLKKIGLRGNTIWHEPRKVSEISHENKARA